MFNFRQGYYLFGLIFIINFLFKLIHISTPPLWYDEIISAKDTLLDFGHIKHEAEWDKNPPFYHYVLWCWCKLFGVSELALRSMSAFFSSITAVLIFYFSNKITNRFTAIIATLVFTLHPFLYYYAQEARCFSFLIFLSTLSLIVLYLFIKNPKWHSALILGVLNFLIFYTHYLAGLLLFCQFIYILICFRKQWIYLVLIYLTPIVLVLIRFTKKQYHVLFFSHETSMEKSNVPLAKFENLVDATSNLYISNLILLVFIFFICVFLIKSIREKVLLTNLETQFKWFVVLAPIVSIAILFILGTFTNVFHERYLLFITPCIFLSFFIFTENKILSYIILFILLSFETMNLKFNVSKKMDYKFAAVLTKEIQKNQDVNILIQTHDIVNLFTYYYDRNIFMSKESMSKDFLAPKNIYYIEELSDLETTHFLSEKPILFFQTYQKKDDEKAINQYFERKGYSVFKTNQIEGLKFSYLFKLKSHSTQSYLENSH